MKQKTIDDVYRFVRSVAQHQGWELHPDETFLRDIVEGLLANYNRHGYFLCPCRDGAGTRDEDQDIVCPCVYNIPDQDEFGHCFCGLFLSREFARLARVPEQIPERRPEE